MTLSKGAIIINKLIFYAILVLLIFKFTFSYLGVELRYWLRHLKPNSEKYNYFNLPPNISEYMEFAIIPLLVLYISLNISKIKGMIVPILLSGIMVLLNVFTSIYTNTPLIDSVNFTFKIIAPVFLFIAIVIFSKGNNYDIKNISKLFLFYIALLVIIALLFFDISHNRGSDRLPIFFTNIHTHCYVLVALFMGVAFLIKNNFWLLLSFVFASFIFLVFGYNVRTAVIQYFIFIAVILYLKSDFFKYMYYRILIAIPFLFLLFISIFKNIDYDLLSSGRLSMYTQKFNVLKDYSLTDYIFGRGYGSDLMWTSTWWWDEKGSHNDYLTFIVENGVPYTIVFI